MCYLIIYFFDGSKIIARNVLVPVNKVKLSTKINGSFVLSKKICDIFYNYRKKSRTIKYIFKTMHVIYFHFIN